MSFPSAASVALRDSQLRRNLAKATGTIREKRAAVVAELPDWQELRAAGRALKDQALASPRRSARAARGLRGRRRRAVHWARDGTEAVRSLRR